MRDAGEYYDHLKDKHVIETRLDIEVVGIIQTIHQEGEVRELVGIPANLPQAGPVDRKIDP